METELTSNESVAKTIIGKLKESKLILDDEVIAEKKIANGTIKDNDWKVYYLNRNLKVVFRMKQ